MYHDATHEAQDKLQTYLDSLVLRQGVADLTLGTDDVQDGADAPQLVVAEAAVQPRAAAVDGSGNGDDDGWVTVSHK
jgi:hypothetical protein